MNPFDLTGKVAIVTGGAQGIGRGIVLCMAQEGAEIAVADLNPKTAKAVADAIELSDEKYCSVAATVRPTAGSA